MKYKNESFGRFCNVLEEIRNTRSDRQKIVLFSDYLVTLSDSKDLQCDPAERQHNAANPDCDPAKRHYNAAITDCDPAKRHYNAAITDCDPAILKCDASKPDHDPTNLNHNSANQDHVATNPDHDAANLDRAVRFAGEGALSAVSDHRIAIGIRTIGQAAAKFCGIDYEKVFKPCRIATGNASEVIEKLMANLPEAIERRSPSHITLAELETCFEKLASAGSKKEKTHILIRTWEQMTPREIRFMIRLLRQESSGGTGFGTEEILEAISRAFQDDSDLPDDSNLQTGSEAVRRAHMLTGSLGETAVLARQDRLTEATFRMFQPVAFMPATAVDYRRMDEITDIESYVAEHKLDGMRIQAHISPEKVTLYSRDLNDITSLFPDVTAPLHEAAKQSGGGFSCRFVLDGVLCIFKNNAIRSSHHLQTRMGLRRRPDAKILQDHPARFIACDVLYYNGMVALDLPLHHRRTLLKQFCKKFGLPGSRWFSVHSRDDLKGLFYQALQNRSKGLILKQRNSTCEYGRPGNSRLKIYQPPGVLKTVIMYAHTTGGRRKDPYTKFTLGIRVDDDKRFEESFIPIGKTGDGLTGTDLKNLNGRLNELAVERFGSTLSLRTEIVVEIEFDDIQINRRTKAGYSLRRPRFRRILQDGSPSGTDRLVDVERLVEAQEKNSNSAPDPAQSIELP